MLAVLHQSWALLLGLMLLMLGNGLQGTLLGVRGAIEGISSSTLGYVMAGYFAGFLLGSKVTPLLLRKVGHVRVFAAYGSLVSAAFILYAAFVHPVFWFGLRLVVGFCFCGLYVVAESWLNNSSSNETRGRAMSLYLMVQMLGLVIGQLLLNVADPGGYELFVLITVLVSLSVAPILLSSSPAPVHETTRPMSLPSLIAASPLACLGMLLLGGVFATMFGMASVYATERGLTVAQTSLFVTSIYMGGLLLQFPIGWLSDRFDRRVLIIGTSFACALSAYVGMLMAGNFYWLVGVAFMIGGTSNPLYSVLLAYANDYLEYDQMASASGGFLMINGAGAMTGPIVVGYAMAHLGIEWFFITVTLLMSATALYGLYRMTRRPAPAHDDAAASWLPVSSRNTGVMLGMAIEAAEEHELDAMEAAEESRDSRDWESGEVGYSADASAGESSGSTDASSGKDSR